MKSFLCVIKIYSTSQNQLYQETPHVACCPAGKQTRILPNETSAHRYRSYEDICPFTQTPFPRHLHLSTTNVSQVEKNMPGAHLLSGPGVMPLLLTPVLVRPGWNAGAVHPQRFKPKKNHEILEKPCIFCSPGSFHSIGTVEYQSENEMSRMNHVKEWVPNRFTARSRWSVA
jgi:hypothetical protein